MRKKGLHSSYEVVLPCIDDAPMQHSDGGHSLKVVEPLPKREGKTCDSLKERQRPNPLKS